MEHKRGFTLIELLAVIVILAAIALISLPIVINIINKVQGRVRTENANRVLISAKYFYEEALLEQDVSYPAEGLEFICNGKACEATIGQTEDNEGVAMLITENLIRYTLKFSNTVPSSGSVFIYSDGVIVPKNIAINSHLCIYDEERKVFLSC